MQAAKMLTDYLEFQVFQPDEFIVGSDSVVVLGHERCRVKATGRIVDANWVQIFTLHNGRISRYREYSDTAAWDNGYSVNAPQT
jgi:ketosteroid isomerase-like protein